MQNMMRINKYFVWHISLINIDSNFLRHF